MKNEKSDMKMPNRLVTAAAVTAVAASALLVPSAAFAAPVLAEGTAGGSASTCAVTGGTLSWGVKESFRSYISGSIANGSWEATDGATYETPSFGWANPTGEIDAQTGEGTVSFTGAVHFTGHDGVLDLSIANPTIVFGGDGTGQLLMDTRSNDAQGQLKIDELQAYLGKIDGVGQTDPASGEILLEEASTVLTSDGATAFGDFYASGEALDPISLSLQLGPCEGEAAPVADAPQGTETETETAPGTIGADDQTSFPWVPVIIGGVAVLVILVTGGMLIAGRKKSSTPDQDDADRAPGD